MWSVTVLLNKTPLERDRVMNMLLMTSKSLDTLAFPFLGGTYLGCFTGWISSSISSSSYISSTKVGGSSSSSSLSIVMVFPFSSIDNLLNRRFHRDIQTGPANYGFFLVYGVLGDLGTSTVPPTIVSIFIPPSVMKFLFLHAY